MIVNGAYHTNLSKPGPPKNVHVDKMPKFSVLMHLLYSH